MKNTRFSGQAHRSGTDDRRTRAVLSLRPRSMLLAVQFLAAATVNLLLFFVDFLGRFVDLLLGRGEPPRRRRHLRRRPVRPQMLL